MSDKGVGYVRYCKDFVTGGLTAKWAYLTGGKSFSGTGTAVGLPGQSFLGNYHVTYYSDADSEISKLDLEIIRVEGQVILSWFDGDILVNKGIGLVQDDILTAGWTEWSKKEEDSA